MFPSDFPAGVAGSVDPAEVPAAATELVLHLARRQEGRTAPFPPVAAAAVAPDGRILATATTGAGPAWHPLAGILAKTGPAAVGATLATTLAPDPRLGADPGLPDRLAHAGITRLVVAVDPLAAPDAPSPWQARLEAAGVAVAAGEGAAEAAALCRGYLTRLAHGRPEVVCKWAMTADGAIAAHTKDGRGISSEAERRFTHQLRDRVDAILVGAGVVLADDPRLTTRLAAGEVLDGGPHHPLRVVVDGGGRSPLGAAILDPGLPGETLVATTERSDPAWQRALAARGIPLLVTGPGPHVDLPALLRHLGDARGANTLLVEGGSAIHGAFFDAGLVDRVTYSVTPLILGGHDAVRPVGGSGRPGVAAAIRFVEPRARPIPGVPGEVVVEAAIARA